MSDQGKTYQAFVENELKVERERRTALDTRSMSVVTTSGSMVTIFAAVATIGRQLVPATPGLAVTIFGTAAVIALLAAATIGLIGLADRGHTVAAVETLTALRTQRWTDDEVDARNVVVELCIRSIVSLRDRNARKSRWLTKALACELLGLGALTAVVVAFIAGR